MTITRRNILQASCALIGLATTRAWALTEATFDGHAIRTLSDGHLVLPRAFLIADGVDPAVADPILQAAGITGDQFESPLNITLWQRGDDLVLFDAGSGPDFMPTAGRLVEALAAIDLTPEQITHVVFTHAHPDHIWGVLDDFDEPVFANAAHLIGAVERDYWMDPATMTNTPEDRQSFVAGAQRRIEALGDSLTTFNDGDEVLPGLRAMMTPGHTPGHTSFDLGDAVIVGDAIGNAHLGFTRPDLPSSSDQDQELAIETRIKLLNRLADSGATMVGYHLPNGGIGTVLRDDQGFTYSEK